MLARPLQLGMARPSQGCRQSIHNSPMFQVQLRERPTLLIDYPTAKPGSKHALNYLHESEFQDPEVDAFRAVAADESPLWKAVAEQLQLSLARLRIYCDPKFATLIVAAVPRSKLVELLTLALDRVAAGRLTYVETSGVRESDANT